MFRLKKFISHVLKGGTIRTGYQFWYNVLNVNVFINNRVYIYLLSESISYFFAEALEMANQYEAKYTETSAALNHNVDELLVGTLDHIRYKLNPSLPEPILKLDTRKSHAMRVPSFKGPIDFFRRLFSRGNKRSPKLLKL